MLLQVQDKFEQYRVEGLVAEGLTSFVYKLVDEKQNQCVALKQFKQTADIARRKKEASIHQSLEKESVIKLLKTDQQYNWLLIEFHGSDDLFNVLQRKKTGFTENSARFLFRQILDCVKYIHEENIYHRDIKLENLLFCKETLKVKLCDFGMAERQGEEFVIRLVGTDGYIAPELQLQIFGDNEIPASELDRADIFSLGVVLFILIFGHQPFVDTRQYKCPYFKMINDKKYQQFWSSLAKYNPVQISPQFRQIIEMMLQPNPQARITLEQIYELEWMKQTISTDDEFRKEL